MNVQHMQGNRTQRDSFSCSGACVSFDHMKVIGGQSSSASSDSNQRGLGPR